MGLDMYLRAARALNKAEQKKVTSLIPAADVERYVGYIREGERDEHPLFPDAAQEIYIGGWKHMREHGDPETAIFDALTELIGVPAIDDHPAYDVLITAEGIPIAVSAMVGYWRKANAVHEWFVENVQPFASFDIWELKSQLSGERYDQELRKYVTFDPVERRPEHVDFRHRALRHHAEGIFMAEVVFGPTITLSTCRVCGELRETGPHRSGNGFEIDSLHTFERKIIPTRWIGEQHVEEDMGRIPSAFEWLSAIEPAPWMSRSRKLSRELEAVPLPVAS